MSKKLVANWKMHGQFGLMEELLNVVSSIKRSNPSDVILCAPYPLLPYMDAASDEAQFAVGAQDVSAFGISARTGEVAAETLSACHVSFVIVGHSERRQYAGDTSELVAQKALRAIEQGITPIICVGETLSEHDAGNTFSALEEQLKPLEVLASTAAPLIIAYEPVWAIGTGKIPTPEDVNKIHEFIESYLSDIGCLDTELLYGGSIKPDNVLTFLEQERVAGVLVGGASVDPKMFRALLEVMK